MPAHSPQSTFSPAVLAARAAALPVMSYPDLPVSAHREEIAEAIKDHQVVIVSGETGSGKTTQLPKICMELGRGIAGMIGHTQPRRIAARAVAERIAAELGTKVGRGPKDVIGYQVRFTDEVGPTTLVKLMTDGILLAEIGSDPLLSKYDTIIVDEAHERSLNIDFILGYLGSLLPRRPDLKVVITSATIDSERFAEHFASLTGQPVPVIEVSGRAHPVEVRYRPLVPDIADAQSTPPEQLEQSGTQLSDEADAGELAELGYGLGDDVDLETALCFAVDELLDEPDGDILVFLPGERDIREAAKTLAGHLGARYVADPSRPHHPGGVEILPLYARLSAAEQHRIYAPHSLRRIVLATNIAETSLTVPGVRYVVDSGLARVSRFSNKTKVQRLPIERIAQASAAQRAGRAGRTSPGVAIRLYSKRDHLGQASFTEPEILRTSLASVILQMAALGLGSLGDFPLLDKPGARAIRDGAALLVELGALDERGRITPLGRKMSRLPIDPRLARMLLEADSLGCASEVLVIVAALSIQDVRERPLEKQQQADQAHARFTDRNSDFLTYLNLWRYLSLASRDMSGSAFRRLCRSEFFHYLRYREWRDITSQLRGMCREIGIKVGPVGVPSARQVTRHVDAENPAIAAVLEFGEGPGAVRADEVHRSILSGLLSNVGNWDEPRRDFLGTRGTHFTIWPGSGLARRTPSWVMAAELVETSRLFARTVAAIKPEWIEQYGAALLKRSYSEPIWSRARGSAAVRERVTLYGLTLAADRLVPLTSLGNTVIGRQFMGTEVELSARGLAREMFISNALVDGDWRENHHAFVAHNRRVMEAAEELSQRLRDPAQVPDEASRYRFFDARIPARVTSAHSFNRWWKDQRRKTPGLLDYSLAELLPEQALADPLGFPDTWVQGDLEFPISYNFEPGTKQDGVSISIPLRQLHSVSDEGFDWLVPGLLPELATAMVRGLPKPKRRLLAPAAESGEAILAQMRRGDSAQEASEPEEQDVDPYSLEASLARLKEWGAFGSVRSDSVPKEMSPDPKHSSKKGSSASFLEAFRRGAANARGVQLSDTDLEVAAASLPDHLRVGFEVIDDRGAILGYGEDLEALQRRFKKKAESSVEEAVQEALAEAISRRQDADGATQELGKFQGLPEEPLPLHLDAKGPGGRNVRGYPAFAAKRSEDGSVARVFTSLDEAHWEHAEGLASLLLEDLRLDLKRVTTRWSGKEALLLAASPYPSTEALVEDAQRAAAREVLDQLTAEAGAYSVRNKEQYDALFAEARPLFEDRVYQVLGTVVRSAAAYAELEEALAENSKDSLKRTLRETKTRASALFSDGYLVSQPAAIRQNLPRYLQAGTYRVRSASRDVRSAELDRSKAAQLAQVEAELEDAKERFARRPFSLATERELADLTFLVEELYVSLFAQTLGTKGRVSSTRLLRKIDALG